MNADVATKKPRLLDQVEAVCARRNLAAATVRSYRRWVVQYVHFHDTQHPRDLDGDDVRAFLTHLATERGVTASTQNQALNALALLYNRVLEQDFDACGYDRAKKPKTLPRVLSRQGVDQVLQRLGGQKRLVAQLLYGCGLRVSEGVSLRVQDLDLTRGQLAVRHGKGGKDRTVPLPSSMTGDLRGHLERVRARHKDDLAADHGCAPLPSRVTATPGTSKAWRWQYVFSSRRRSKNKRSGIICRHHTSTATIQRAVRQAGEQARLGKRVTPHVLRHSYATHLIEQGVGVRVVQKLLGHSSLKTTQKYLHVADAGSRAPSPLDSL